MSATTATKPLPTAEQLKAYADQLPEIYRDVLSAFATANPRRKYGGSLAIETVLAHVANRHLREVGGNGYEPEELTQAISNLMFAGLLEKDMGTFGDRADFTDLSPTPPGEELIAVLTGRRATQVSVPDLPKPGW